MEVDSIECSANGAIVTFRSRSDAEIALTQIVANKFKNRTTLKWSWFDEKPASVATAPAAQAPAELAQPVEPAATANEVDEPMELPTDESMESDQQTAADPPPEQPTVADSEEMQA